jgi:hypothetical protein
VATITVQRVGKTGKKIQKYLWETLTGADDGSPVVVADGTDGSIQATGTFDSATLNFQGSNDGGTTWFNLTDETGTEIALTAAGGKMFLPRVDRIRPLTSGGGGSCDIDVYMVLGRTIK